MDRRPTYTTVKRLPPGKARRNRRRKDWNRTVRRCCILAAAVELAILLLANPVFWVRNVHIVGLQTLYPGQVFVESGIQPRTNIFTLLFREPIVKRLQRDPVIEHATRLADFPDTVVLRITERQPYAVLLLDQRYWLLSPDGIPFRLLTGPVAGLPLLKYTGVEGSAKVTLGSSIDRDWVLQSFKLLTLIKDRQNLDPQLITVDQNGNLCLNRADNLQIRFGQPEDLPRKLAVAVETLPSGEGAQSHNIAYLDVTDPEHPAFMPRGHDSKEQGQ